MRAEPRQWTAAEDALILGRRREGCGWAAIAAACGTTKYAVRQHGVDDLGLAEAPAARPERVVPDPRPPMSPGDPDAWGLLLALTPSLGNAPYCYEAPRMRGRMEDCA